MSVERDTSNPKMLSSFGLKADIGRRVAMEIELQLRNRLEIACWVGAVLIPMYASVDIFVTWHLLPQSQIKLFVGLRFLCGMILALFAYLLRKEIIPNRYLPRTDMTVFTITGVFLSYSIGKTWNVVGDYYLGIAQIIIGRCVFFPGGPRRAMPACLGLFSAFPIGLLLFSGDGFQVFMGESGVRVIRSCSGLLGCIVILMFGSFIYERMMFREVESRYLGRYHIEHLIGQGGMGAVYKVWDNRLDRYCAIKVINSDQISIYQELRSRFEREARQTSQLHSSHIVQIYDYGETITGDMYYAMEFLDGMDLQRVVDTAGPQPPGRVIRIARQICIGLTEAHKMGLVHRDIKPANIFLTPREEDPDFVKILDFGLVKRYVVSDPNDSNQTPHISQLTAVQGDVTQNGILIGTPAYMAPEQIKGVPATMRSDIYALGGVMYFLLTAHLPFSDSSVQAMLSKISLAPESISQRFPHLKIPDELERIVMKCLEPSPSERFQTTVHIREALEAILITEDVRVSNPFPVLPDSRSLLNGDKEKLLPTEQSPRALKS